jgi:hypothetical protein
MLKKMLQERPWLLVMPFGFLFFFLWPKNRHTSALFLISFGLFIFEILITLVGIALVFLSPFFLETFFIAFQQVLLGALVILHLGFVISVYLFGYEFKKTPLLDGLHKSRFTDWV